MIFYVEILTDSDQLHVNMCGADVCIYSALKILDRNIEIQNTLSIGNLKLVHKVYSR